MPTFCEKILRQWEGDWEGVPFKLEDWQRFIFEQVFGWIRRDTGTRRFQEVYVQIAKKNGKSSMSAGLMNFHLNYDDKVKTPKVFTAANNEDQAKICVNMAGRIIESSPALASLKDSGKIGLMRYKENITDVINYENNGFIKAFSKETSDKKSKTAGGKHGVNASLGVVDEFGMSADHGSSGAIKTSMASRRERLMFYITTAGYNLEGPCYRELRKVGIQVLEGTVIKDNYLPIIYEIDAPKDEEGRDREITMEWIKNNEWAWKHANPNVDISVNRDFLRDMVTDAIQYGGSTETDVKTLNFNIWCDSPEVFIPADVWNKNSHGVEIERGSNCYGGIEIGSSGQISAVSLLFPGDPIAFKMLYFASEDTIKSNEFLRDHRDLINIDPGNEVENEIAIKWIVDLFEKYNLLSFCFPSTQKNNSIIQGLIKLGYEGNAVSQGMQGISNATEEWEKMLRAGDAEHFNDPILAWMNSNCLAVRKEIGTRIEKNGKVLGIYACINAVAQWKFAEAEGKGNDQIILSWK